MIKEKLTDALKTAAAEYNGGMSADKAVAKAAIDSDFNEKQAERLVEMFNTAAAINQEKRASDPTGTCELASKSGVLKLLMDSCSTTKSASCVDPCEQYSFYGSDPVKTNASIEARSIGIGGVVKAASSEEDEVPEELNVSQRSLYKIISGQIDLLKSASSAADDVIRNLNLDIERESIKVAKAIEYSSDPDVMADMFKAACDRTKALKNISEYSTKLASSNGGIFSKMEVFDASPVEDLLKIAEDIEREYGMLSEYEAKRDFYMSKAAEAENEMMIAVGLRKKPESNRLTDMFIGVRKEASCECKQVHDPDLNGLIDEISCMMKESESNHDRILSLTEKLLEKDAGIGLSLPLMPRYSDAAAAFSKSNSIGDETSVLLNVRRALLLSDLMSNDPIIRDADPATVTEAYKTMVMASPRVSLDKAQVRAFLRSAVNSVAISPNDAKVITDVDRGILYANADIDRMTTLDSSIKDSNT